MSEKALTRSILAALNRLDGCKAIKVHGSRYVEAGTPDVLCVRDGRAYLIEVKQAGERPTVIQAARLEQWASAGAVTAVVRSRAEALAVVAGVEGEDGRG